MTRPKPELLCRYHYDPIDRLAGCSPLGQQDTHGFYHLNRLSTEIQGAVQTSWLQTPDLLLAQRRLASGQGEGMLLATDVPGSVIHALSAGQPQGFAYLPYGLRHPLHASLPLPGFNGERLDPVTGHYLLGNGYRAFNPVLMRFNSPDSLSPFGEGGVNAYGYCAGDPVNRVDATGHSPLWWQSLKRLGRSKKPTIEVPYVSMGSNTSISSISSTETTSTWLSISRKSSAGTLVSTLKPATRRTSSVLPASAQMEGPSTSPLPTAARSPNTASLEKGMRYWSRVNAFQKVRRDTQSAKPLLKNAQKSIRAGRP